MPNRDGFLTLTKIAFLLANDQAAMTSMKTAHVYEIRPRKDDCGVNLISDVLPLRCAVLAGGPDPINNAIDYAKLYSRSHVAVIRVYDDAAMSSKRTSSALGALGIARRFLMS